MHFQLSEEQLALQKLAREIADREFKPRAARWDEKEEYPAENLPTLYRAATNAGQGFASIMETSMAKTFANEMSIEVTNAAIQIHGSYGYTRDFPLERVLRDARGWPIAGGTAQIQRNTIASLLLGRRFTQRKGQSREE